MSVEPSFGELKSDKDSIKAPPPEAPFRIVVLGDFSGRASRGEVGDSDDIANRKSFKIARDNFDDIMKKVGVKLSLKDLHDGETAELEFNTLEEIHPDTICEQVSKFNDLDSDDQGKLLSSILHHPHFQGIESAWRGLYWLLARVKEIRQVQGVLVDISQEELIADVMAQDNLTKSGLYRMLVEKPAAKIDGQPWSVLIGLYTFKLTGQHLNALCRMGKIAREAAAPFLAAAPVEVSSKDWEMAIEVQPLWSALRKRPEAAMIGLAMPHFLLRLPYGSNTKSIEKFEYEEWTGPKDANGYLWGNPALGCACLLAMSFAKEGWAFKAGKQLELAEMVMHTYTDEDDDRVGRMAEAMLTRKEGEKIAPLGLMNFVCSKNRDIIELVRFQSLGEPAKGQSLVELLAQWGQKGAIKLPPLSTKMGVGGPSATAVGGAAPPPPKAAASAAKEEASEETAEEETPAEESAADEAPAEEAAAEEKPAEEEMDPELAALMKQLEGGGDEAPAAEEKKEEEKPAEEEMDPELAALMKQLEGGGDEAPAAEEKKEEEKPAEEAPAEEEMDPELAALLKQLEGGEETPPAE
jgi:hypothetical protein